MTPALTEKESEVPIFVPQGDDGGGIEIRRGGFRTEERDGWGDKYRDITKEIASLVSRSSRQEFRKSLVQSASISKGSVVIGNGEGYLGPGPSASQEG